MSLSRISPPKAKKILDEGAVLIDIREPDEHLREHIADAKSMPLSRFDEADLTAHRGKVVLFHCRSGARTLGNASRLAAKSAGVCEAYILEGGLDAWRRAGLPVAAVRHQPIELQRQVQIAAGSMALFGTLLGLFISPWFFAVPLFIGAGLTVAGITGFCGMARLLIHMPWNRATFRPQAQRT